MTAELLGAKFIAPYYGNSLYVWSGVLGVTLAGLAGGYFIGSYLSKRYHAASLLFSLMLAGALAIALMPFITDFFIGTTLNMELRTGIVFSCISLLLVPLVCFGTVSPLMIKALSATGTNGGKITGNVYAISTIGGIVSTILTGFYLVPQWGLMNSAYLAAGITALFPSIFGISRLFNRLA